MAIVLAFLSRYWVFVLAGVLVVSLLTGLVIYVRGAEKAKVAVVTLTAERDTARLAAEINSAAAEDCLAINAANAAEALKQAERAREAEIRLAAASAGADEDVENINREANTHRATGAACPAIDSDFRRWLRGDT